MLHSAITSKTLFGHKLTLVRELRNQCIKISQTLQGYRSSLLISQVWFDVAFAITCPVAAQVVVTAFDVKWLISHQRHKNRQEIAIERGAVLAFDFALVIAFKR